MYYSTHNRYLMAFTWVNVRASSMCTTFYNVLRTGNDYTLIIELKYKHYIGVGDHVHRSNVILFITFTENNNTC